MRALRLIALVMIAVMVAAGQGFEIDTETEQGKLLQLIGTEKDQKVKLQMLEQFLQKYPDDKAVPWVLAQIPPIYAALNEPMKSLAACEQLLKKDPTNAAAAHACLKTAEAQKNPDLTRKWALLTEDAAVKRLAKPKPKFEYEEDEEAWKEAVDFAAQVKQYAEWALYNGGLQTQDPNERELFVAALRKANPKSKHLPQLTELLFRTYVQTKQMQKAVEMADAAAASGGAPVDMLVVVADHSLNQKQPAKAIEYCEKIIAQTEGGKPPAGVDAAAWTKQAKAAQARAYWMMGVAYSTQGKYVSADKALRKALPGVRGNPALTAGALFHLGLANFKLGAKSGSQKRILDAFKFTKECVAMKSPYQAQARKNLKAIQSQYRIR